MHQQTQIVTHSNILDPRKTLVMPTTAKNSDEIIKDLLVDDEVYEVVLSKNSVIMSEPFDIKEGDVINVMLVPKGGGGGGKSIISLVAMIAIAVYAPVITANLVGAMGIQVSATGFYALQAGVILAGGILVNAVLGSQTPTSSLNTETTTSTTYSWDESYNKFTQGTAIPKVFGTHKITPPLVSKYIETFDNKQYWNGLYALNDGVINSVTDIKINDESIANFDNVTYEVRYGYNDQLPIPSFDNTKIDKQIGRKLSTSYVETSTDGNEVTALTATLVFPRGIFYANDSGGISAHSVKVVLEYSSDGINFTRFGGDTVTQESWNKVGRWGWKYTPSHTYPYTTISGAETSTIRKTFKLNYLPPSKYYVRARFYEAPPTTSRYGSDCYLEYITEEIGDDFTYPSTALIAIRALATDQLNGNSPKISCVVTANSNNPALIAKQILSDVGISSDRILPSFDDWEDECTSKGYTCNIVFDSSITVQKALEYIGVIGRASIIQFGSKFHVVMDRAEEIPVQSFMFGMGNILRDSFKQTFLPILDRANVIEVTYYDAEFDYEATVVEVSNSNYDSVAEENRTAITLVGCTNREQAIKHARYQLNCNRYITETLTIEADKDSLVCRYGDIVRVSHDVPQYGFSGRIISCTTDEVVIDREVTMEVGKSYYIQIKDKDNNVLEHYVNNEETTTNILQFTTPLDVPYDQYDIYAFGEVGKASKLYRVMRISTKSDLTRSLELVEYNEDIYNDGGDIIVPQISSFGLSNLRATDYIRYAKDKSIETVMQLSWNGSSIKYTVQYGKIGEENSSVDVYDNKVDLVVDDVDYNVIVTDSFGNSISTIYSVIGKLNVPTDISNLQVSESGNNFNLTWEHNNRDIDFLEYVVYLSNKEIGRTKTLDFSYYSTGLETKTFTVKSQDTSNVLSTGISISSQATPPNPLSSLSYKLSPNGVTIFWTDNNDDTMEYEVRTSNSNWGSLDYVWKGNATEITITDITNRTYYVKVIDKGGNYSTSSSVAVNSPVPSTPSNITSSFSYTSTNMANVTINWNDSLSPFGIDYYTINDGTKTIKLYASEYQTKADWIGNKTFSIIAYDIFGLSSSVGSISISKLLPNSPLNFTAQVIDNNILFYWNEPTPTSLPIVSYELRRGASWDTATVIGKKSGAFTTIFENVAGVYTYWIASIDADNRYSTPISLTATVSQPPDFVLKASNTSNFSGTKSNVLIDENGEMRALIDTVKTWSEHFTSRGLSSPQSQIDAGYPLFIQPSTVTAYYEETVDLGTVLASSRVTINLSGETVAGTVNNSCDISTSIDGVTWTTFSNVWQVYSTNFRYYKFKINFVATDDHGLYKVSGINSVLDVKLKNDAGSITANASDIGGTTVNFNIQFVDVTSITVTPQGTTPLVAMYDFTDTPYPTSFKVLLFNQSGARVNGTVSWSVKGY